MTKKSVLRLALLLVTMLSVVITSACGKNKAANGSSPEDPASSQAAASGQASNSPQAGKEPIKIALLQEQTGRFSWYGNEVVQTAEMWQKEVNGKGGINGRQVEFVTYDTQSDPQQTITGFDKIVTQDKVNIILGPSLVEDALAVDTSAQEKKVLMFSTSGGYVPRHPFNFAGVIYRSDTLEAVAEWYVKQGIKKVAYLGLNDETGQQGLVEFKQSLKKRGIELLESQFYNGNDVDVTGQVRILMKKNPEAIEILASGKPTAIAVQALHQLGVKVPVTISHSNLTQDFLKAIKNITPEILALPGTKDVGFEGLDPNDPQYPLIKEFVEKFEANYKRKPALAGGAAWDSLNLIKDAIEKTGGTDTEALVKHMENVKGFMGVQGIYEFTPEKHRGLSADDSAMIRVQDNKFVFYK